MIEISNLTKRYGKFAALEGFNLSVPLGSIFGLVGINGAGKSTLLRVLSGVFRPDEGSVKIEGEEIFENERKKRELLYLPDEPFSTSLMNGRDVINRYKVFYSLDEAILNGYVDEYKLDLQTPIRNMSKGMKRQLFVSIALACNPKYLLVDEVFDGLDPMARMVFKRGIKEMSARANCTIILASHSLRELEDICDSYGLIDGKKILNSGSLKKSIAKICKFQVAFAVPVKEEDLGFECVSFETSGQIAQITFKGEKQEFLDKIERHKPLIVEEVDIGLEEMFVSDVKEKGGMK